MSRPRVAIPYVVPIAAAIHQLQKDTNDAIARAYEAAKESINNALNVNQASDAKGADNAKGADKPATSPEIKPDELSGKTKPELEQLARDKGLVQDPNNPNKWRDPETGKERLLIHEGHIDRVTGLPYNNPNAAVPHTHGFDVGGKKIGNPSNGNDPHFPFKP